jgi:hypothetical protein
VIEYNSGATKNSKWKMIRMTSQTRNLIMGIAGIVVSVCAGIWTFYNYNIEERKTEVNAIFEISKRLEEITLANNEPDKDIEDVSKKVFDLYVVVQHKYNQIKKPFFTDSDLWKDKWQAFYKSLKTAYTDGYEHAKENINNNWEAILRMKKIEVLEETNEV